MTAFALRGLLGRKLRTVLTAIAIVLGVATVSGTYVLTDSINNAFHSIFFETRPGSDVVISGKSAFDLTGDSGVTAPSFDESLLQKVRDLPDVAEADGQVNGQAQLIGKDGKAIVYGGAPNLGFSIANGASRFNPLQLVSGRVAEGERGRRRQVDRVEGAPEGRPGDRRPGGQGPVERLRVSGHREVRIGVDHRRRDALRVRPADRAAAVRQAGQARRDRRRRESGRLRPEAAGRGPHRSCRPHTQVRTRAGTVAARTAKETDSFISFLQKFLLGFGGVALFVGSFVIANSLSITIAQRTREFATLRTLGASRGQVLRSVVLEALVMGIARVGRRALRRPRAREGPLLALRRGRLHAAEQRADARDADDRRRARSSESSSRCSPASGRPCARPACRRSPRCAREQHCRSPASRGIRLPGGDRADGCSASRACSRACSCRTSAPARSCSPCSAAHCSSSSASRCSRCASSARSRGHSAGRRRRSAARPARSRATTRGAIPQRTASTASALMIGLALVTLVSLLAAGIVSSFRGAVKDIWRNADYAITAQNNFTPIPIAASEAVTKTPGVTAVGDVRAGEALAFGNKIAMTAVNPPAGADVQPRLDAGLTRRARESRRRTERSSTRTTRRAITSSSAHRCPLTFADGSEAAVRRRRASSTRRPAARRSAA